MTRLLDDERVSLARRVSFVEKDVIKDPKNLEELAQKTGGKATPTLVIGEEGIVGLKRPKSRRL